MAQLTPSEFAAAVAALAAHHGVEQLRERLARMNAFTSRRGLNTSAAIAERLHLLTGGLRRQVPATYAFSSLWNEMVGGRLGDESEKTLEKLADGVNACLTPEEAVAAGKEGDLDEALGAYRAAIEPALGPEVARLDMLLKAVPAVAERLRVGSGPSAPTSDAAGTT
jgi:hypothetical protein